MDSTGVDDPPDGDPSEWSDGELRAERGRLLALAPLLDAGAEPETLARAGWLSWLLHGRGTGGVDDVRIAADAYERAFTAVTGTESEDEVWDRRRIDFGLVLAALHEAERRADPDRLEAAQWWIASGLRRVAHHTDRAEAAAAACLARYLLACLARTRHELHPEDRALLDQALDRQHDALADEDPEVLGELHRSLGDLYYTRSCLVGDWDDLTDAEASARHYRLALPAVDDGGERAEVYRDLGISLQLLGRGTDSGDMLLEALDAFERARSGGWEGRWWADDLRLRQAYVRALLWSQWDRADQAEAAEAELEVILAEPDALVDTSPAYLDLFGRLLYERAVVRDDLAARDRAIGVLRYAVDRWVAEDDGSIEQAAFCLSMFQYARYLDDRDTGRLADVIRGAELVLESPEADAEARERSRHLRLAARGESAFHGLAELTEDEKQELLGMRDRIGELFEGDTSQVHLGDLSGERHGVLAQDLLGNHRLNQGFDLLYDRWLALEPGSQESGVFAWQLLNQVLYTDLDRDHVTREQRETLFEAAIDVRADKGWKIGLHGTAALLHLMSGMIRGREIMGLAMAHLEKAAELANGDPELADKADFGRVIAMMVRGQQLSASADTDTAVGLWRRIRRSDHLTDAQKLLLDAQCAPFAGLRAVGLGDLAEADRNLAISVEVLRHYPRGDLSRIELWTLLANLHLQRNGAAEKSGVPAVPHPEGEPTDTELRQAADRLPRDHRAWVLGDNGICRTARGLELKDPRLQAEGLALIEAALELCEEGEEHWIRYAYAMGLYSCMRIHTHRDLSALDTGIHWLERARGSSVGPGHPQWADAGISLGMAYRLRSLVPRGAASSDDRRAGRRAGLSALQGYSWAALLQSGTDYATEAAAEATRSALSVAGWCLEDGVPEEAVQALDACRGLVLHAATTAMSVPEKLEAVGRADLAAEWRALESAEPSERPSGSDAPPGARTSSELRLRVLDVLTGPASAGLPQARLLDPPGTEEIGAALRTVDADALVYLVPAGEDRPGTAVVVTADGRTSALPLPLLSEEAAPVRGYRPAPPTGRDLVPVPEAGSDVPPRPLRAQLDRLCSWAWYAAVKPLGDALRARLGPGDRALKLVLVPMGALGAVPWHAAWEGGPGGSRRYAIQDVEISYAASARLLCDVVARPAVPHTGAALIVGNPTGDLGFAGEEARSVGRSFYREGEFLGQDATPEAVLRWLRDPGNAGGVLHLACHGTVAEHRRHTAYLTLAGGTLPAEALTEGVRPGQGQLELVVLAACRSHVSGRGDNEAFSLATAFLVAGARAVVGSLWPVPDEATSVLMYMTHQFLRRAGDPPARALRRAQLWMLDPLRQVPEDMPEPLVHQSRRIDPDDLSAWAGFTHLGR